jgi:NADH:ubiquinone oxidoreductase subunit 3 (subunit A)
MVWEASSCGIIRLFDVVVAALIALSAVLILYALGGRISAKGRKTSGKLSSYASGEDFPSEKLQVNLESFFLYAIYFLVFDVLAFVLSTSLGVFASGSPASLLIFPLIYAAIVLAAIVLIPSRRRSG